MRPQQHWDARAAANFTFGGTGSGLLLAGAVAAEPSRLLVSVALLLIAAGLLAVWLETGRRLRAIHVLFNPFTSWMTRESFAAVVVFGAGGGFLLTAEPWAFHLCVLAAAAFLWCQARILYAAKGIPAWRAPQIVPLVLTTGLAEGAALSLFLVAPVPMLVPAGLALVARAIAWRRYRAAAPNPALEQPGALLLWAGTAAPLAFFVGVAALPWMTPIAALAALLPGWWLKLLLIARAAHHQPYSLPRLPVRGTR